MSDPRTVKKTQLVVSGSEEGGTGHEPGPVNVPQKVEKARKHILQQWSWKTRSPHDILILYSRTHYSLLNFRIVRQLICGDFPVRPVVKTLHFQCRGSGFDPCLRN